MLPLVREEFNTANLVISFSLLEHILSPLLSSCLGAEGDGRDRASVLNADPNMGHLVNRLGVSFSSHEQRIGSFYPHVKRF